MTLSRMASEPSVGFGSATRENVRKASVPRSQLKDLHGTESPGPHAPYVVGVGAIGKQVNSKYGTTPKFSISSRLQMPQDDISGRSPGPMYAVPASVGPQTESYKARGATPDFGSSTRDVRARVFISREHSSKGVHGRDTPGPAAPYFISGSLGKQISSKTSTRPSSAFGRASRWSHYERERKHNAVPGPGAYND